MPRHEVAEYRLRLRAHGRSRAGNGKVGKLTKARDVVACHPAASHDADPSIRSGNLHIVAGDHLRSRMPSGRTNCRSSGRPSAAVGAHPDVRRRSAPRSITASRAEQFNGWRRCKNQWTSLQWTRSTPMSTLKRCALCHFAREDMCVGLLREPPLLLAHLGEGLQSCQTHGERSQTLGERQPSTPVS